MNEHLADRYQKASRLAEELLPPPTEMEMQALWFEQLFRNPIATQDGGQVEVLQLGIWNHGAGPDFQHASLWLPDGTIATGSVEMHVKATDWETHGHGQDPAYENTLLHVVWEAPAQPYTPATRSFRAVPQAILCDQLLAPWAELRELVSSLVNQGKPLAHAGHCAQLLSTMPQERALALVRAAGEFRLRHKARRLALRSKARGKRQALWEGLAEGLGYANNKVPMRVLAQRVTADAPAWKTPGLAKAQLFGMSGFLPRDSAKGYTAEAQTEWQSLWEQWWQLQGAEGVPLFPRGYWKLAGVRPANRPERRIAALHASHSVLKELESAVAAGEVRRFAELLANLRDPFWQHHATFRSPRWSEPLPLIGEERVADLVLNLFWPLVYGHAPERALQAWREMRINTNRTSRIAEVRVLGASLSSKTRREALVQQGLLQIYHDYCLTQEAGCARCPFPEVVRTF